MSRRIQAPGIEINEFDRSAYDSQKTNNSLTDTVSFVCGFADKGENYTTKWINSKNNFLNTYGYPTNEPEQYFYNAAVEVLNKGGILLTSKLPYNNDSLNKYNTVTYSLETHNNTYIHTITNSDKYSVLTTIDPSLRKYLKINSNPVCKLATLETLDNCRINNLTTALPQKNSIMIFDISRTNYTTTLENTVVSKYFDEQDQITENTNECLGIVPIITTPLNALYLQNYSLFNKPEIFSDFEILNSKIKSIEPNEINLSTKLSVNLSELKYEIPLITDNDNYETQTISKMSLNKFPNIIFLDSNTLEKRYLKSIGICVYRVYKNTANNNVISFEFLESFVGSLDKTAINPDTNGSDYICNIVNQNSKYINIFTNIKSSLVKQVDSIGIDQQTARSLGFYKLQLEKKINAKLINDSLTTILTRNSNKNNVQMDLIIDAGITTISQIANNGINGEINFTFKKNIADYINNSKFDSANDIKYWQLITKKIDDFCKYTRKDCMFINDIYRSFCIKGNQKIVRSTDVNSSIVRDIIPKLRYISGVNSSYTAGYSDWFQITDEYSGDLMWLPPSIKAAGIYIYTDIYGHHWDAPAGLNRGIVKNVVDVAFSPSNDEAGKIYKQCWNYAINYPINGITLEGQKTMQLQKTAFDRVNVRRLFLYLEKRVIRIAKYFLYEGNTVYLRQRFVDTIRPLFEDAVAGYGILEYYIKCDETNNTSDTIDNNELHCQIAIKPVKTIEFIILDFICTNQSGDVTEIVEQS